MKFVPPLLFGCAVEDLVFAADTDFASLLPDIAPPTDEETDDSSIVEAAAAGEADADLAAAAVAGVCLQDADGAACSTSPVNTHTSMHLHQQQTGDCKSPLGMPW